MHAVVFFHKENLSLFIKFVGKIEYPTVNNDSTVKSHLSKLQLCTARKYNTHFNYVQCVHAVNVEMLQSQEANFEIQGKPGNC